MIVIGLIGKIGAGKSTVARRFADLGARVIDADALAHEVLEEPDVRDAIRSRFGNGVFAADGRVQRRSLGERVFGPTADHAAGLRALEAIVHPRVHERIDLALAAARSQPRPADSPADVVVLDVPLLLRAGWDKACDRLVIVECDEAVRRQRLAARQLSREQQAAREAAWEVSAGPDRPHGSHHSERRKTSTVDTSGDLAYTQSQVDRIWGELQR